MLFNIKPIKTTLVIDGIDIDIFLSSLLTKYNIKDTKVDQIKLNLLTYTIAKALEMKGYHLVTKSSSYMNVFLVKSRLYTEIQNTIILDMLLNVITNCLVLDISKFYSIDLTIDNSQYYYITLIYS
jgi:hypothetical protein